MATCFIIGAAGKVGTHLTKQLCARQHAVSALHRKPEQAEAITVVGATTDHGRSFRNSALRRWRRK